MLYAHYEGFCYFALLQYIKAVNQAAIKCDEATSIIVASAWSKVFMAVETGDQKSSIFKSKLPDDARLHRFARRCEFIEQFADFVQQTAQVPDDMIDTESNLWPKVMRRNLYLLGLDHDVFSQYDREISTLIDRRNNIAHGADRNGLKPKDYDDLETAVFKIMDKLMDIVMEAIQQERYKRQSSLGTVA